MRFLIVILTLSVLLLGGVGYFVFGNEQADDFQATLNACNEFRTTKLGEVSERRFLADGPTALRRDSPAGIRRFEPRDVIASCRRLASGDVSDIRGHLYSFSFLADLQKSRGPYFLRKRKWDQRSKILEEGLGLIIETELISEQVRKEYSFWRSLFTKDLIRSLLAARDHRRAYELASQMIEAFDAPDAWRVNEVNASVALVFRAKASEGRGRKSPALTDYERALELNSNNVEAYESRCNTNLKFGYSERAELDCQSVVNAKLDKYAAKGEEIPETILDSLYVALAATAAGNDNPLAAAFLLSLDPTRKYQELEVKQLLALYGNQNADMAELLRELFEAES